MRIGIENAQGVLVRVIETTRLVEAVMVFEVLAEFGLVPSPQRRRCSEGRWLTRVWRQPPRPWACETWGEDDIGQQAIAALA